MPEKDKSSLEGLHARTRNYPGNHSITHPDVFFAHKINDETGISVGFLSITGVDGAYGLAPGLYVTTRGHDKDGHPASLQTMESIVTKIFSEETIAELYRIVLQPLGLGFGHNEQVFQVFAVPLTTE